MIEHNNYELLKLCFLIEERRVAEVAWQRAVWRVAYYRKIKARLDEKNKSYPSKWNNNATELSKKIESARLTALKKNKIFIDVKKKLRGPIARACELAKARLVFENGKIICLRVGIDKKNAYILDESEFKEKAAQYEATHAMNKVLSS